MGGSKECVRLSVPYHFFYSEGKKFLTQPPTAWAPEKARRTNSTGVLAAMVMKTKNKAQIKDQTNNNKILTIDR